MHVARMQWVAFNLRIPRRKLFRAVRPFANRWCIVACKKPGNWPAALVCPPGMLCALYSVNRHKPIRSFT